MAMYSLDLDTAYEAFRNEINNFLIVLISDDNLFSSWCVYVLSPPGSSLPSGPSARVTMTTDSELLWVSGEDVWKN